MAAVSLSERASEGPRKGPSRPLLASQAAAGQRARPALLLRTTLRVCCFHAPQWIPPHERARAVSLTTSGMYLGSAAAMLALPALAAAAGPAALLRAVGGLGLAWLCLWLAVGREVPHRWVAHSVGGSAAGS